MRRCRRSPSRTTPGAGTRGNEPSPLPPVQDAADGQRISVSKQGKERRSLDRCAKGLAPHHRQANGVLWGSRRAVFCFPFLIPLFSTKISCRLCRLCRPHHRPLPLLSLLVPPPPSLASLACYCAVAPCRGLSARWHRCRARGLICSPTNFSLFLFLFLPVVCKVSL